MSVVEIGTIRSRSVETGAMGETETGDHDHNDVAVMDRANPARRYWLRWCSCEDCERARGANDDHEPA